MCRHMLTGLDRWYWFLTSLHRHKVLSLVFTVMQAAGQNYIIIVALEIKVAKRDIWLIFFLTLCSTFRHLGVFLHMFYAGIHHINCLGWYYILHSQEQHLKYSNQNQPCHAQSQRDHTFYIDLWCEHYLRDLTCICMIFCIVLQPHE